MTKPHVLSIKNVSVAVGAKPIVHSVSLSVHGGEVHVLAGQNGSGKSSLINALMGHPKYAVTEGDMHLDRQSVLTLSPDQKAKNGLFLSMQHLPAVDGITLAYFLHQAYKAQGGAQKPIMDFYREAQETARSVGISEALLDRPLHAGLSGGEKKQSEIIQLLMLKPKFAFLDEIDSGVDVDARKKVWRGVEFLRKGGTGFLIVTHHTKFLKQLPIHKIHIMESGKLIRSGDVALLRHIEHKGFEGVRDTV